jgi:hypothetical protein
MQWWHLICLLCYTSHDIASINAYYFEKTYNHAKYDDRTVNGTSVAPAANISLASMLVLSML